MLDNKDIQTPKIIIMTDDASRESIKNEIHNEFPELSIRGSMPPYIEVFEHSASKGNALKKLAEIYGIKIEQTMAIGDTGIDLCMIEQAGIGVAMGDSADYIRDKADYVTKDYKDNGAAYAIEKFCL